MKNIPPLLDGVTVVEAVLGAYYCPNERSLDVEFLQVERGQPSRVCFQLKQAALLEILQCLRAEAERRGTSIEALARPHAVQ